MITTFEDLEAWKSCREGYREVRKICRAMPKNEFDLKDNILRAARSTTRNIAEGYGRFSYQENTQFCRISRGSLYEILDDIITLKEDEFIDQNQYLMMRNKIETAIKILNGYIKYLQNAKNDNNPKNQINQ